MAEVGLKWSNFIEIENINITHLSVDVLGDFLDDVWITGQFLGRRGGGVSILVKNADVPGHHREMSCWSSGLAWLYSLTFK